MNPVNPAWYGARDLCYGLYVFYKSLLRPILFLKDPETTHEQTLSLLAHLNFLERVLAKLLCVQDPRLQVRLGPLTFANPVGLSAGFDKNGKALSLWPAFGFGFYEIGAVTAVRQPGNPKPRLFRLPKDGALINRLGFNNDGAEKIGQRLERWQQLQSYRSVPMGINIGRSRHVENSDAVADYLFTFERLFPYGDYFTINVSSPNTPNLRELQEKERLGELLGAITAKNHELAKAPSQSPKPILVKIAPDLDLAHLDQIVEVVRSHEVAAIIATNATAFLRETLRTRIDEPGGLSGRPLKALAMTFIRHIYQATEGRLPIIGSGGVFNADDAYEMICAGATAVQIYTSFVYEGPTVVKNINRGLLALIHRDGFTNVSDAVGSTISRS